MKKIIPFKKDIIFKTNIAEITSISLEHTLSKNNNEIKGEFSLSGEYLISKESIHTENFEYNIPFDIHMDEKYDLGNATIDIDDFYYEIVNNNILDINIDVLVDRLEEKLIIETPIEEVIISREDILENTKTEEERCIELEEKTEEAVESIFDNIEATEEKYKSYKIYIVREGDDLEYIMEKYSITKDILEQYNDLKELKIGDKIIIPAENEYD